MRNTAGLRPPWQPGESGNPGGRPKGAGSLAALVRQLTQDGAEVAHFYFAVFNGRFPGKGGGKVTPAQRMEAAAWLADRGFGRSIQTTDLNLGGFEGVELTIKRE